MYRILTGDALLSLDAYATYRRAICQQMRLALYAERCSWGSAGLWQGNA